MRENRQIEFDLFPTEPTPPPKSAERFRKPRREPDPEFDFTFGPLENEDAARDANPSADAVVPEVGAQANPAEQNAAEPASPEMHAGTEQERMRNAPPTIQESSPAETSLSIEDAAPDDLSAASMNPEENEHEQNSEASTPMTDSDFEQKPVADSESVPSLEPSDAEVITPPAPAPRSVRAPQFIHPETHGSENDAPEPAPRRPPALRSVEPRETLGETLEAARELCGMSLQDVADATKIRIDYLRELEANKLQSRLPMVFVSAYVRTLCDIYRLDADSKEMILRKRCELSGETEQVPRQLIDELDADKLVNAEEEKRVRRLFLSFGIGLLLLLVLAVWGAIALLSPDPRPTPAAGLVGAEARQVPAGNPSVGVSMSESELERFITPEEPHVSVLKMSASPALDR